MLLEQGWEPSVGAAAGHLHGLLLLLASNRRSQARPEIEGRQPINTDGRQKIDKRLEKRGKRRKKIAFRASKEKRRRPPTESYYVSALTLHYPSLFIETVGCTKYSVLDMPYISTSSTDYTVDTLRE